MNIDEMLLENNRRLKRIAAPYNPITGEGSTSIPRTELSLPSFGRLFLPTAMVDENARLLVPLSSYSSVDDYLKNELGPASLFNSPAELSEFFSLTRIRHDFEFWAASYVTIKDKETARPVPFILNPPQRTLLAEYEKMRLARKPIRLILVKARQWGGSTLTQVYMAWIQLVHRQGWNSVICAHVRDASSTIKGMYTTLLDNYPASLIPGCRQKPSFHPFERTTNISRIDATDTQVTIGSAETPDSVRAQNVYMCHFSEVAMFPDTPSRRTADLIASIVSPIPQAPYTVVVMESTARGEGDYFYKEYQKAKEGNSDKVPLFIPWFAHPAYSTPVDDPKAFAESLSEYESRLFSLGATLQAIAWYRNRARSFMSQTTMHSEFPSDDVEAFASTGEGVFDRYHVARLRQTCRPPAAVGEVSSSSRTATSRACLSGLSFAPSPKGLLSVWSYPDDELSANRYVVTVDVGGRGQNADFSVVSVLDRYWMASGGVPEVAAQWRGHIDHDLLVWKAAQIASFYKNALLVFESNTIETDDTDGDHTEFILDTIASAYPNLYARTDPVKIREGQPVRYGFHTNRSTKTMIIDHTIALLREEPWIERDDGACIEFDLFERKQGGATGAKEGAGNHDDILMTRMIGLYVSYHIPLPSDATDRKLPSHSPILPTESSLY